MVFQDGCGSAGLVLCLGNSSSQAAAGKSADSSYNGAGLRIFSSSCSSSDELEISKQTRLDQLFPSNSTTGGADSEPITLSLSLANTSNTHHVSADHEVGALKANIAKIDVNKVFGDDDHDEKDELGSAAPPPNLSSSNSPNYSSTRESYVKISTYNNKYVKRERDHQHQVISTTTTTHPAEDLDQMNIERVNSSKSTTLGGDDDDEGNGRKKLRLTKEQSALLEDSFKEHSTLNPKQKQVLAKQLNLRPRQVEVWFQNRRARTKLKQTEVDCEFLKRCCETLTDENRRLHKELQELRALKFASPLCMQLPAATLTMCPSCERIATKETNKTHFTMTTKSPFYNPLNHSSSAAC